MAKYRKKPVVIEAVRVTAADYNPALEQPWDGSPFSIDAGLPVWLIEAVDDGRIIPHTRNATDYAQWDIATSEGTMTAQPGDWIIRGVKGELYPCKPDIFELTYEAVEPDPAPEQSKAYTGTRPCPLRCGATWRGGTWHGGIPSCRHRGTYRQPDPAPEQAEEE